MIEVPDYIYERSVIKQLYLKEESRHLFQKNAYSVSINREEQITGYVAEASEVLSFKGEPVLTEKALNEVLRKSICLFKRQRRTGKNCIYIGEGLPEKNF